MKTRMSALVSKRAWFTVPTVIAVLVYSTPGSAMIGSSARNLVVDGSVIDYGGDVYEQFDERYGEPDGCLLFGW